MSPSDKSAITVAIACLLMAAALFYFTEVKAGVYFKIGPNYIENFDTDGVPVDFELGYKGNTLRFIGSPKWYARWYHASDYTGGILTEPFDEDDYSVNTVGFGLCWGDC